MPTIPLWLVFGLQSLVVALSFTALILVLVLQQQTEYKDSVFREIDLRHDVINDAMTAPIITRERIHTQLVTRLTLDHSLWFQYQDSLASVNVQRFLNHTYFMIYNDPLSYAVYQFRLSPDHTVPGEVGVERLLYGVAGLTSDLVALVTQYPTQVQAAPNPTFPLQFSAYFTATAFFKGNSQNEEGVYTRWGGVAVIVDTVTNHVRFISIVYTPLEFNYSAGATSLSVAYSVDVHYLVNLVNQSRITTDTKALLVERMTDEIVASINMGVTLYNETASVPWELNTFPNQAMSTLFKSVDSRCDYSQNCTKYAMDDGENILMLLRMTTTYNFRIDLLQITPRSFYFAAGEKTLVTGVIIGVVAAVVVLLSCVLIWFAIRGPVIQLQESMLFAAVMRNDEIADTSSVLTEMNSLSQSFMQMNSKLLQARAFMPQSMLYMTDDGGDDDEEMRNMANRDDEEDGVSETDELQVISPHARSSQDVRSERSTNNVTPSNLSVSARSSNNHDSTSRRIGASRQHSTGDSCTPDIASTTLVSRKVAVLILNARGTHRLAAIGGSNKLEYEQKRLVELIERCARVEKGVVDAFQGDHFVLTFNAVRSVAAPGRNAALMALNIEEGAEREQLTMQKFSMGLCTGRALVGNVGSTTMKKNVTIGSVYTNAIGLERLAKRVNRTCVVNSRCLNDLEHLVSYMLLGTVQLTDDERDVAGCVLSRIERSGKEEWLYEMNDKLNPLELFNRLTLRYIGEGASATQEAVSLTMSTTASHDEVTAAGDGRGTCDEEAGKHLMYLIKRRLRIEAVSESVLESLELHETMAADYDVRS